MPDPKSRFLVSSFTPWALRCLFRPCTQVNCEAGLGSGVLSRAQEVKRHREGSLAGPTLGRGGTERSLPSVVRDMSFFEVKLVQKGLPIKQVVKRLSSHFKETRSTTEETAGEPQWDPAWEEVTHGTLFCIPVRGPAPSP